ncbi:hypothetical protein EQV77_12570 [Halobacillus fulvus]|nr:hypothetical protein EQV77_12570 [Halobacillus fulvus]
MNFLFAARLLDEGHALARKSWNTEGYIFKDERGRLQFFDRNEPNVYQPSIEDTLADDWVEKEKDNWAIVSVTHDLEVMQNKRLVSYHICSKENGKVTNNHLIDQDELATWSHCVDIDMDQTAVHLNEQDVAQVKNVLSA